MAYKRRKYLIDKKFQFKFIAFYSYLILINIIIFIGITWFTKENNVWLLPNKASLLYDIDTSQAIAFKKLDNNLYEKVYTGEKYYPLKKIYHPDGSIEKAKFNSFDLYIKPILFITLINIIILTIFSIFFSHKIAGPIYKIKKILHEYSLSNKYKPIHLRKKDFLHDLSEMINKIFASRK